MNKKISDKIIKRLTLYHCILVDYISKGLETVSSPVIASLLHIDESQVRRDITILNKSGKKGVGYNVIELKKSIEIKLGFSKDKPAFIVGAGNLGFALAKYSNFENYGLKVLALFDNDENKIGKKVNNKEIYNICKIKELSTKMNVEIAILTVPRDFAQGVTNELIKANFKYIWNFTPVILEVPENVFVLNENLMGNFLKFTMNKK